MDSNIPEWPSTIPTPLIGRKHHKNPRSVVTLMESGRARVRRRFVEMLELIDVQWNFTEDQYQLFESFFLSTLANGSLPFLMMTFDLSSTVGQIREVTRELAFMEEGYSFVRGDNLFAVTATLEVLDTTIEEIPDPNPVPGTEEEIETGILMTYSECHEEFSLRVSNLQPQTLYVWQIAPTEDGVWTDHVYFALQSEGEVSAGQKTVVFNNDYEGLYFFRAKAVKNATTIIDSVITGVVNPRASDIPAPDVSVAGLTIVDSSATWATAGSITNYRIQNSGYIDSANGMHVRLSNQEDPLNFFDGVYTAFQKRYAGRWKDFSDFGDLLGNIPSPKWLFPISILAAPGAVAKYTLDGTNPTLDSPSYFYEGYPNNIAPHRDDFLGVIRVRCFKDGCRSPLALVGIDKVLKTELPYAYALVDEIDWVYYCDHAKSVQSYGYQVRGEGELPTWGPMWQDPGLCALAPSPDNCIPITHEELSGQDCGFTGPPGTLPGYTVTKGYDVETGTIGLGDQFDDTLQFAAGSDGFPYEEHIHLFGTLASLNWRLSINATRPAPLRDWIIYKFSGGDPAEYVYEWTSLYGQNSAATDFLTSFVTELILASGFPPAFWIGLDITHSPFFPISYGNPRDTMWFGLDFSLSLPPAPPPFSPPPADPPLFVEGVDDFDLQDDGWTGTWAYQDYTTEMILEDFESYTEIVDAQANWTFSKDTLMVLEDFESYSVGNVTGDLGDNTTIEYWHFATDAEMGIGSEDFESYTPGVFTGDANWNIKSEGGDDDFENYSAGAFTGDATWRIEDLGGISGNSGFEDWESYSAGAFTGTANNSDPTHWRTTDYSWPQQTPDQITGLKLWLDASDLTTLYQNSTLTTAVAADGDPVGGWKDKSGSLYHGLQATSGKRPLYKINRVQGKYPTVLFDGTDDYLDHSAASGALTLLKNLAGATIVAVVKKTTGSTAMYYFAATTNAGTVRLGMIFNQTTADQITAGGRRLDADAFAGRESGGLAAATFFNVHGRYNYTGAQLGMFINGVDNPSAGAWQAAGNTSNTDSTRILTGAFNDLNQNFNGEIAELMIWNKLLSTGERDNISGYLRNKYDIF